MKKYHTKYYWHQHVFAVVNKSLGLPPAAIRRFFLDRRGEAPITMNARQIQHRLRAAGIRKTEKAITEMMADADAR
ncbi:MAG: hypothetical protein OXI88_01445 [Gammaproteobacteria bacterium]|nr:hypothetical protein [Gammaproteobacteria bacterium]MDE0510439.1 hypothetical protein [Gammaproteobacteria bacterium]